MEYQLVNRKSTETYTQKRPFFSKSTSAFFSGLPLQRKLTIGEPDDPCEREADAMADKVMRMPEPSANNNLFFKPTISSIQRKCAHCEEEKNKLHIKAANTMIQKQPTPVSDIQVPHLTLSDSFSIRSSPTPDYLAMQQPFLNRNIFQLWDPNSALQVWQYNFNFFRRLGLSSQLSNSLTNFTAPRFIGSQLMADNPTWWEITDQELNTSSIMGSIPVLEFGPDFSLRAPSWFRTIFQHGGNAVQRKCQHCEAEEKKKLQRKGGNTADVNESTSLHDYVTNLNGKGKPLPYEARYFFESRFGYDFSSVKAHTNTAAAQSAQSINALAYTTGNNIVFNRGQYDPLSDRGKRLLAHELTHVIQQNKNLSPKTIQRKVNPARVSCNSYPRTYPIFTTIGTNDPVAVLSATDSRAIEILNNTIGELAFVQQRIQNGASPSWPTFSDCLGQNLAIRMLIDPERRESWTTHGPGTVSRIIRMLTNFRDVFAGGWIRYECISSGCEAGDDAFVNTGEPGYLFHLCESFWKNFNTDYQAIILIHELAHIYYNTEDRGFVGPGSSYCIEHFLASLNSIPVPPSYRDACHFNAVTAC